MGSCLLNFCSHLFFVLILEHVTVLVVLFSRQTIKRCDRIVWLALCELTCNCCLVLIANFTLFNSVVDA
jgi:hypothetical protein